MEKTTEELKRLIFDLMNGSLNLEKNPMEESKYVEDAFAEGRKCAEAYLKITDAYQRLCQRLRVEAEDDDIEIIINNFNIITEYLCLKMFDYCYFFTQPSIK